MCSLHTSYTLSMSPLTDCFLFRPVTGFPVPPQGTGPGTTEKIRRCRISATRRGRHSPAPAPGVARKRTSRSDGRSPPRAEEAGCRAVIPSKSNRTRQRPLDKAVCAARDVIERFFGRIKGPGGSRPALTNGRATSPPLSSSPSSAACCGMPQNR